MYKQSYYTSTDQQEIFGFMQENPFAILCIMGDNNQVATHVPIIVEHNDDGKIYLTGHIMRKTDHHLAAEKNNKVLLIFNGPHCFVSASWYHNVKSASTWNYMTVHAHGTLQLLDEEGTYQAIKALTNKYEDASSSAAFNTLDPTYIKNNVAGIIGFKVEVTKLDNVFKLSQNRDVISRQQIIHELLQKADPNSVAIANEMTKRLNQENAS